MQLASGATMKPEKKIRPPQTGEPVQVRLQPEMLEIIDAWRRKQEDLPNRAEAIRRMIRIAAERKK
jgi:Arc/MetJ-type ribon-helix-helix transcriptional regulator